MMRKHTDSTAQKNEGVLGSTDPDGASSGATSFA